MRKSGFERFSFEWFIANVNIGENLQIQEGKARAGNGYSGVGVTLKIQIDGFQTSAAAHGNDSSAYIG